MYGSLVVIRCSVRLETSRAMALQLGVYKQGVSVWRVFVMVTGLTGSVSHETESRALEHCTWGTTQRTCLDAGVQYLVRFRVLLWRLYTP